MTREKRDEIDGTLPQRTRDRIAEAYRTAAESYCQKWEELQGRQAEARSFESVPGLARRCRSAGLSAQNIAYLALAGESTVRRALSRDLYSPEVLATIRQQLGDQG